MIPSPISPRPSSVSGVGEPVADVEADDLARRAGDLGGEPRVPADVVDVDHDAEAGVARRSTMSLASPSVTIAERSPTNIGCSGSMPSRTPSSAA